MLALALEKEKIKDIHKKVVVYIEAEEESSNRMVNQLMLFFEDDPDIYIKRLIGGTIKIIRLSGVSVFGTFEVKDGDHIIYDEKTKDVQILSKEQFNEKFYILT
ncbi:MAG: hypothetical protein WC783_02900 [Candidatus Paceibacterota bacterium]|jgi:hypothetical protein